MSLKPYTIRDKSMPNEELIMEIPIWQKYVITIQEASFYFRIGENKLRQIVSNNSDADFILWNGNRPLIKRVMFERYINSLHAI